MVSYGMICFAIRFEHKHILKSHEHFGVKKKKKKQPKFTTYLHCNICYFKTKSIKLSWNYVVCYDMVCYD